MKTKFKKVDDCFTVNMYDNGYMVEIGGRDTEDEWRRSKIVCNTIDEVVELVKQIAQLPRDN